MTFRFAVCMGLLAGFAVCAQAGDTDSAAASDSPGTLLWISDIHFDPFAGGQVVALARKDKNGWRDHSEWGAILKTMPGNSACSPAGSDADSFLFQKVLEGAARQTAQKVDCVLLTGDLLAHDFNASYFSQSRLPASLTTPPMVSRMFLRHRCLKSSRE